MAVTKEKLDDLIDEYGHLLEEVDEKPEDYVEFLNSVYKDHKYGREYVKVVFEALCPDGEDDNEILKNFANALPADYPYFRDLLSVPKTIHIDFGNDLQSSYFGKGYPRPNMETLILGPNINHIKNINEQPNLKTLIIEADKVDFQFACLINNPKLETIEIKNSIYALRDKAFENDIALKEMDISNFPDPSALGEAVFKGCKSLTTVILPEGLKKIPTEMFKGCSNLDYIFLPDSVEKIESKAFEGCDKVQIRMHRRPDGKGIKITQEDVEFFKKHLKIKK